MSLGILLLACLPVMVLSKLNGPENPPSQRQQESKRQNKAKLTSKALVYVDFCTEGIHSQFLLSRSFSGHASHMAVRQGLGQQTSLSSLSPVISTHPKAFSVIQVSV